MSCKKIIFIPAIILLLGLFSAFLLFFYRGGKIKKEELTEKEFLKEVSSLVNPDSYDRLLSFAFKEGYQKFKKAYKAKTDNFSAVFGKYSSEKKGDVVVTKIKGQKYQISYLTKFRKIEGKMILTLFDSERQYSFNLSEVRKNGPPLFKNIFKNKKEANFLPSISNLAYAIGFSEEARENLLSAPQTIRGVSDLDADCLSKEVERRTNEVMWSSDCLKCYFLFDCDDCEQALQEAIAEVMEEVGSGGLQECRFQYDLVVDHLELEQPIAGESFQVSAPVTSIGESFPYSYNSFYMIYDASNNLVKRGGGGGYRDYNYFYSFEVPSLATGLYRITYEITTVTSDTMTANTVDPFGTHIVSENSANNFYEYYFTVLPRSNQVPRVNLNVTPNPAVIDTPYFINPSSSPLAAVATITGSCQDSDGTVIGYELEYGDGMGESRTGSEFTKTHAYFYPGQYQIRVSCGDEMSSWTDWTTQTLIVNEQTPSPNQAPTAYIDQINPNPATQKTFSNNIEAYWIFFRGYGTDFDGWILTNQFEWDFGDGTPHEVGDNRAFHAYYGPGSYTIKMRVKDNRDRWSDWTRAILLIAPEQSQITPLPTFVPTATVRPTLVSTATPTLSLPFVLNSTFTPNVVAEGEKQKLILEIKNESEKVLVIQGIHIDWYYNQGQGFYLAEQQDIRGDDPLVLATKVSAWTTKTIYEEVSKASGKGEWRGEITVFNTVANLTATVTHTIR